MLFSASDVIELLKRLEEVQTRSAQGCGEDYLAALLKTMKGKGGEREALQKLMSTRLALAKCYAKCTTSDIDTGSGAGWGYGYGTNRVQIQVL